MKTTPQVPQSLRESSCSGGSLPALRVSHAGATGRGPETEPPQQRRQSDSRPRFRPGPPPPLNGLKLPAGRGACRLSPPCPRRLGPAQPSLVCCCCCCFEGLERNPPRPELPSPPPLASATPGRIPSPPSLYRSGLAGRCAARDPRRRRRAGAACAGFSAERSGDGVVPLRGAPLLRQRSLLRGLFTRRSRPSSLSDDLAQKGPVSGWATWQSRSGFARRLLGPGNSASRAAVPASLGAVQQRVGRKLRPSRDRRGRRVLAGPAFRFPTGLPANAPDPRKCPPASSSAFWTLEEQHPQNPIGCS